MEQDRDRLPFARHDDGPRLGRLHILGKIGSDFVLSCYFHSSTSFPPTSSRLPSFSPIAWIWTSWRSSSIPYSTRKQLPGPKRSSQVASNERVQQRGRLQRLRASNSRH